jgi:hypothetical protein
MSLNSDFNSLIVTTTYNWCPYVKPRDWKFQWLSQLRRLKAGFLQGSLRFNSCLAYFMSDSYYWTKYHSSRYLSELLRLSLLTTILLLLQTHLSQPPEVARQPWPGSTVSYPVITLQAYTHFCCSSFIWSQTTKLTLSFLTAVIT